MNGTAGFTQARHSAPAGRVRHVVDKTLSLVDANQSLRVLDIGCGDGSHALALAAALPGADILGVDISPRNIEAARAALRGHPAAARVRFEQADYMAQPFGTFDLILSVSGINYIPADAPTVFRKLDAELAEGGVVLLTVPTDCRANRANLALRALFRLLRCRALDAFALFVARRLHAGEFTDEQLRERIFYIYTDSALLDSTPVRSLASDLGWRLALGESLRQASPAQLRHRLLAWVKPPAR